MSGVTQANAPEQSGASRKPYQNTRHGHCMQLSRCIFAASADSLPSMWLLAAEASQSHFPPFNPISPHSLPSVLGWGRCKPRVGQATCKPWTSDCDVNQLLGRCALVGGRRVSHGSPCHSRPGPSRQGSSPRRPPSAPSAAGAHGLPRPVKARWRRCSNGRIGACHRPGDQEGDQEALGTDQAAPSRPGHSKQPQADTPAARHTPDLPRRGPAPAPGRCSHGTRREQHHGCARSRPLGRI